MEKFEVNILGCGSALPTTRHFSSSQVVNIREKLFMVDCGEGAQLQLRRSKLKFGRLNHIFISHLHGDHCFGLMGLISTFGLLGRTATLHIYAHAELEKLYKDIVEDLNQDEINVNEYYLFFQNGKQIFPQYIEILGNIENSEINDVVMKLAKK